MVHTPGHEITVPWRRGRPDAHGDTIRPTLPLPNPLSPAPLPAWLGHIDGCRKRFHTRHVCYNKASSHTTVRPTGGVGERNATAMSAHLRNGDRWRRLRDKDSVPR